MTMVEIIAIIATGILGVLCIICVAAVLRNGRQATENSKAIKDIEKSLSTVGDSIKDQTNQLIEQLEKKQYDDANERRLEQLEEEIKQLIKSKEETAAAEAAAVVEEPAVAEEPEVVEEPEAIEELDDEIELDDLFRELNAMEEEEKPVEPEPQPQPQPTRYHQGYNIGRSGRRYTAEELNVLIRE